MTVISFFVTHVKWDKNWRKQFFSSKYAHTANLSFSDVLNFFLLEFVQKTLISVHKVTTQKYAKNDLEKSFFPQTSVKWVKSSRNLLRTSKRGSLDIYNYSAKKWHLDIRSDLMEKYFFHLAHQTELTMKTALHHKMCHILLIKAFQVLWSIHVGIKKKN